MNKLGRREWHLPEKRLEISTEYWLVRKRKLKSQNLYFLIYLGSVAISRSFLGGCHSFFSLLIHLFNLIYYILEVLLFKCLFLSNVLKKWFNLQSHIALSTVINTLCSFTISRRMQMTCFPSLASVHLAPILEG